MSLQELYDVQEALIQEHKKLIYLECMFPVYNIGTQPFYPRFIIDPNDVIARTADYRLHSFGASALRTFVPIFMEWVRSIYEHVHQTYVHHVLERWKQMNKSLSIDLESPEMEEFREWTAIYVRSCLTCFWTESLNDIFLKEYESETTLINERIPPNLREAYKKFHKMVMVDRNNQTLYRRLLSVHMQPHMIMPKFSMHRTVALRQDLHFPLNGQTLGSPCLIIIPGVFVDFNSKIKALVFVDHDPSSTAYALPSWCGSMTSEPTIKKKTADNEVYFVDRCDCYYVTERDKSGVDNDHPDKEALIKEVIRDIRGELNVVKARSDKLSTLFHEYPTQKSGRFIPSHHEIANLLQTFSTQYTSPDKSMMQLYVQMISECYTHVVNVHVKSIMQEIWNPKILTGKTWHYPPDEYQLQTFTEIYLKRALLQVWTSEFDRQWQSSLELIFQPYRQKLGPEGAKQLNELHAVAQNSLYRVLLFTNIFQPHPNFPAPFAGQVFTYDPALHFPVHANTLGDSPPCATILVTFCVNVYTTKNQSLVFIHPMDVANPCYSQPDSSSEVTVSKIVEICSRHD